MLICCLFFYLRWAYFFIWKKGDLGEYRKQQNGYFMGLKHLHVQVNKWDHCCFPSLSVKLWAVLSGESTSSLTQQFYRKRKLAGGMETPFRGGHWEVQKKQFHFHVFSVVTSFRRSHRINPRSNETSIKKRIKRRRENLETLWSAGERCSLFLSC